jgi:flagellar biosynthesis protein FliQ
MLITFTISFIAAIIIIIIILLLLTPWSTVLLEKLTGRQLVKKFPAFYGTRRFITALINVTLSNAG